MNTLLRTTLLSSLAGITLGLQACASDTSKPNAKSNASGFNEAAIEQAATQIDETQFMQHVNILASDEFEGRAPSTAGGKKTVEYLENEFKKLGLAPAFGEGSSASYRQAVELMELTVTNSPALAITYKDGSSDRLAYKENSIVTTSRVGDSSTLASSDLVFVGYGVVAPEYGWNDYAGVDMRGKTAVILVNDPGFRKPEGKLFKGRTMTYYGRWTYKYEEAARQGAAGAIIVHEDAAAGYPWEVVSGSWSGAQYYLLTDDGNQGNVAVESWITKDAAQELFEKTGHDYKSMVMLAGEPGFKPVALSARASSFLKLESRKSTSYNVGGVITGRTRPDELFVYTAHWDHLGVKPDNEGEDKIFNGAQDNATGTAGLIELAQAFKALPTAPERSVMVLAVTAEESGLLGSKQYGESPAFPMAKTVGGINIDSMPTNGASDNIVVVGFGNSQMDDFLKIEADKQNRVVVAEPTPEKGFFYRSDHFNLAKKGVPMLYAKAGTQIRNKPEGYGEAQTARYISERYHKAGDQIHPEWDNGGILQDLNAFFRIGVSISDSNAWPQWAQGNEFKAIRDASQQ